MLLSRNLSDFYLISFFTSFLTKAQILSKATKMQFCALKLGLHEISHRACDGSRFLMAACAIKRGAFYVSRPDSKASEQKEVYNGAANMDRILVTTATYFLHSQKFCLFLKIMLHLKPCFVSVSSSTETPYRPKIWGAVVMWWT